MNKILLPKGLANLRDSSGNEVDYDLERMIFAHGIEEGVLEQLVLLLYFRGGEEIIDKPYHVTEIKQPLTQFYAVQLAIRDIEKLEIENMEDAAKYLASEHVLVVPSLCNDAVEKIKTKFNQAYEIFEKWKSKADSVTVEHVTKEFEEAIVPAARLRIREVIFLYNDFLAKYEKIEDGWLASKFDHLRRDIERSISDTMNSSMDGIYKLPAELKNRPILRNARLIDVLARNIVYLGFESDKDENYNTVRKAYTKVINSSAQLPDRISAYASLIIFDMLLQDNDSKKKHFEELKKLGENHPKTIFIENILAGRKQPLESKLAMVGLDKYYHPDLLDILVEKINSYSKGKEFQVPFPVHRMEYLLDHAKKTMLLDSYKVKAHDLRYICYVFNQNPYVSFSRPSIGISQAGRYFVLLPLDGFQIQPDIQLEECERDHSFFRNPDVEKLVKSDIDRYLLNVPVFIDKGSSLGSQISVIPRKGYRSKLYVNPKNQMVNA